VAATWGAATLSRLLFIPQDAVRVVAAAGASREGLEGVSWVHRLNGRSSMEQPAASDLHDLHLRTQWPPEPIIGMVRLAHAYSACTLPLCAVR
jgi:hypothetical protein